MTNRTQLMSNKAAIRALGLSLILGATTSAFAAPSVEIVAVNGSGCPNGHATVSSVASDLSSFTVDFAGYSASRLRRNCIFGINVAAPPGYTYAVTNVPASGEYNLQPQAVGYFDAYYYFMGMPGTATTQELITDDSSDAWSTQGAFDAEELVYAPCNTTRYLFLNTALRVSGDSSGASSVSMDPTFTVQLAWKKCG